jgi:alpha-galactosidase
MWEKVSRSLGNWDKPEPDKLPSGLPALADYVRSTGMQFGLWFEPERIAKGTRLEKAHPDWVLWRAGYPWGLLDFGRPEVQEWAINLLDRHIKELGLRYIRWDFNYDPLWTWETFETPERYGILQIRHVEGLHRVEDWLRQHYPEVILESCSSGGLRIDLQTIQRRPTIWISDQTADPRFVRFHLQGLNHFLPGSSQMVALVQDSFDIPDIDFQSYFGGAFGSMGRLDEWPPALKKQARKHVNVFKKIRKFLAEDYYLLLSQPRTFGHWEGWQFHNPETDEGFVQAFRTKEASESLKNLVMMGLNPNHSYRFTDPYTGESFEMTGAEALSEGVKFKLLPTLSSPPVHTTKANMSRVPKPTVKAGSSKLLLYQGSR